MTELDAIIRAPGYKRPINFGCWALCSRQGKRWHVRRIVWGRTLAREEKREGEVIKRAAVLLREVKS
jgi:hypothetical protein